MTAISVLPSFPSFFDKQGRPLEAGKIYIGAAGSSAQSSPIATYWDKALTITAAQPIRTVGGYPSRNGSAAVIYTAVPYSITVTTVDGSLVYSTTEPTISLASGNIFSTDNVPDLLAGGFSYTASAANIGVVTGDLISTATEGYVYRVASSAASDHDLTTATGVKLYIEASGISPRHFGATPSSMTSQSAYIQSAIDVVRLSWNSTFRTWRRLVDLGGETYTVGTSLNVTGIRTDDFTIQNGGLYGICTGRAVIDGLDSIGVILENINIIGSPTAVPACAVWHGRRSDGRIAPNWQFRSVLTDGWFTYAAYVNGGSEALRWVNCHWINKNPSLTAYTVAFIGDGAMYAKYIGGLTSNFQTPATSGYSHISQELGSALIKRPSQGRAAVTAATIGANCVLTVATSEFARLDDQGNPLWAVGGRVHMDPDSGSMPEVRARSGNITAVNSTLGTITTDLNTTGYTAWTTGSVWRGTGSAMLGGSVSAIRMNGIYMLTYGAPSIVCDASYGTMAGWDLLFQQEQQPRTIVRMVNDSGSTAIIRQLRLKLLSQSQAIRDSVFDYSGTGGQIIRGSDWEVNVGFLTGTQMSQGVFSDVTKFEMLGADLTIPFRAECDGATKPATFTGSVMGISDGVSTFHGSRLQSTEVIEFANNSTPMTTAGFRYASSTQTMFGFDPAFSAERGVLLAVRATQAQLRDIAHGVNTINKFTAKMVYDTTNNRPVWANGSAVGDVWRYADGTTAHTPV